MRTTGGGRIVTFVFVEGVAALIQTVDHVLTLVFFVVILLQAVYML